jgi:hypothetical protein
MELRKQGDRADSQVGNAPCFTSLHRAENGSLHRRLSSGVNIQDSADERQSETSTTVKQPLDPETQSDRLERCECEINSSPRNRWKPYLRK